MNHTGNENSKYVFFIKSGTFKVVRLVDFIK